MPSPTLVIADYPIGHASGFGETLLNLFTGFPDEHLWSAHLGHLSSAFNKQKGRSVRLPSPRRPRIVPTGLSLAYYPVLKAQQYCAFKRSVQILKQLVEQQSIRNLLVVPVTPWICFAALALQKDFPDRNLMLFVMDDWQGHHESHRLPYSRRRRRVLRELIDRASTRFAVSREMATHYKEEYQRDWHVAHNGVCLESVQMPSRHHFENKSVLLAGDVNEFRFDAVLSFAEAIDRHNQKHSSHIEFRILGEVAPKFRRPLTSLRGASLLGRQPQTECLNAMRSADLLYLPLAFSRAAQRISRYSMPTKLPEYLATGKPVFFHAPAESALFQVAERYDLNPRLATTEEIALDNFIMQWQREAQNVEAHHSKALAALSSEFDIKNLSSSFQVKFN